MSEGLGERLHGELEAIRAEGLYKDERVITTAQGAEIAVSTGGEVVNFCANNYLGLANHPRVLAAAHRALDDHGFGMASVRFICGTQDLHKSLEAAIARFFGTEDAILAQICVSRIATTEYEDVVTLINQIALEVPEHVVQVRVPGDPVQVLGVDIPSPQALAVGVADLVDEGLLAVVDRVLQALAAGHHVGIAPAGAVEEALVFRV